MSCLPANVHWAADWKLIRHQCSGGHGKSLLGSYSGYHELQSDASVTPASCAVGCRLCALVMRGTGGVAVTAGGGGISPAASLPQTLAPHTLNQRKPNPETQTEQHDNGYWVFPAHCVGQMSDI